MSLSKFLKRAAKVALPVLGTIVAPGIGTALGSTLGTAALSGIGGAIGGGVGGALDGGGLKGALTGAALGGAGGYVAGGGLSDFFGSTTSPLAYGSNLSGDFASGLSQIPNTSLTSPIAAAARGAMSNAATAPSGLSGAWANAAGAGGASGGGSLTGFFSNPTGAIKQGVTDMLSPDRIAKSGLAYLFNRDAGGGYKAVQNAANEAGKLYSPYLESGTQAQRTLANLYGVNGAQAAQDAMAGFRTAPGYEFARDQGIKALDASAARRGMLLSGNQMEDVQKFGTGLADQYYQQYLNNLAAMAGQGMTAADNTGTAMLGGANAYLNRKASRANNMNQLIGYGLSNFYG